MMRAATIRVAALVLAVTAGLGGTIAQSVQPTIEQLAELRARLAAFEDVAAAEATGYEPFGTCMSGPQVAQGLHYRAVDAIGDPGLDPLEPGLLMYEARQDGSLRLIGAAYIVFQDAWHGAGNEAAPSLLGREFSLNTTLLDEPFYAVHVWAWHYNPLGLFAN